MPLRKLSFIKDSFYHIYSRGNRKETIFFEERDYRRFLERAEEYRNTYSIDIIAYCLLSNHFHFLVKQLSAVPTSKFIGVLLNSYARYASIRYQLPSGHLFQGRFGAKLIETPESLLQTSRYIHLNPIKKDILDLDFTYRRSRIIKNKVLIQDVRKYLYSSYQYYLNSKLILPISINLGYIKEQKYSLPDYRKFVESKITDEDAINLEDF